MTKFYFDCRVYDKLAKDREGIDLTDMNAVEREAVESAVGIACDEFPRQAGQGEVVVTVRDESGRHVLKVTASMSVEVEEMN